MKKLSCILVALFYCVTFYAQKDYYVQVGVFEEKVPINYYSKLGSNIFYSYDDFGFHRYYLGKYTEADAATMEKKANDLGYLSIAVNELELTSCACNRIPVPRSLFGSIQNIFFDFDRSNLRAESRRQLNDLHSIMQAFPTYTVLLRAHTDAKGSNTYNEALSMRRADSAKQFLINKGVSSSRIRTATFGEETPIAKNEINGQDTEAGRQFNRRVEIIIYDEKGDVVNGVVEEIDVPDSLKK